MVNAVEDQMRKRLCVKYVGDIATVMYLKVLLLVLTKENTRYLHYIQLSDGSCDLVSSQHK